MFITRASRHDVADIEGLLEPLGVDAPAPRDGTVFIARDGAVVGSIRMKEVAPHAVVLDKFVVHPERRREGIGTQLLQAAMNSRGGKLYVFCHSDFEGFFTAKDFDPVAPDALPEPVMDHFIEAKEYPAPDGHPEHLFFTAR